MAREDGIGKKYLKQLFPELDKPMGEQMVYTHRDDSYPSAVKGSDVYYWFREHHIGYRQPFKELMEWKKPVPSGKYRLIKKGYVGLRTPYHPDGRW